VTSARRHGSIPEIQTVAESALPGYQVQSWYGILVPAGTRADVVNRINAAFTAVLNAPDTKAALIAQGGDPDPGTPADFARLIRNELVRNARITRAAGMRPE
jgi:tripartite-type tricarboxylate transporter receptor subunit TctC